jgi:hypothetical protein
MYALGVYKMFEGSTRYSFGWINHTQGAARLVELQGLLGNVVD